MDNGINRRNFITKTSLGTIGAAALLASCSPGKPKKEEIQLPELLDQAPDGKVLKAGLIGCGGRGTGAAINFLEAGPNLQITALGDVFQDKIDQCRSELKTQKNVEIADENCFIGFESYQKVIDSGVDIVLLCTPPHFRPLHVEAAVNARKHVFMEKPVAVDPVGARSVLASAKRHRQLVCAWLAAPSAGFKKITWKPGGRLQTVQLVISPELILSEMVAHFGTETVNHIGLIWNICFETGLISAGFRVTILPNSLFTK
jgi:hypothetical protein